VEFDVMMAAADMADCPLTNEAMAHGFSASGGNNPQTSR
jgi:hypothetical protein